MEAAQPRPRGGGGGGGKHQQHQLLLLLLPVLLLSIAQLMMGAHAFVTLPPAAPIQRRGRPLAARSSNSNSGGKQQQKAAASEETTAAAVPPPPSAEPAPAVSLAQQRLKELPDDTTERIEVVRIPEYEEVLAWAQEMDRQVAERRIAGLGGRVAEPSQSQVDLTKRKPLKEKEERRVEQLVQLLSQRRESQRVFFPNEIEELREAIRDLEALLKDDADHLRKAQQDLLGNKAGRAKSRFQVQRRREVMIEETGDFDPIYGSKGVRDQIYLFLWSLVKRETRYSADSSLSGEKTPTQEEEE